jgi:uncharacterized GH25 family protein
MRGIRSAVVGILAISICQPAVHPELERGSISAVLLDPKEEPVRNTSVNVSHTVREHTDARRGGWSQGASLETATGPAGELTLAGIHAGFVDLRVTIPGMLPVSVETVRLREGEALVGLRWQSPGYGGRLLGSVIDEEGEPVAGAVIEVGERAHLQDVAVALGRANAATAIADQNGDFYAEAVPPGKHEVAAYAPGYPRSSLTEVEVAEGGEVALELVLRRCLPGTWTLAGTLTDPEGRPLKGATVLAAMPARYPHPHRPYEVRRRCSGQGGEFVLDCLPPDEPITVEAYDVDHGTWREELRSEAGEYVARAIELQAGPGLQGKVIGPDGRPLVRGEVRLRMERVAPGGWETAASPTLQTDETGAYRIVGLLPGTWGYKAGASFAWVASAEGVVLAPESGLIRHDIVFPSGATVRGVVVGPNGEPIPGAHVAFQRGWGGDERTRAGADGAFELSGLSPGHGYVHAQALGYCPTSIEVTLEHGDLFEGLTLQLGRGTTVSGRVLDPRGEPLPGADIRLGYKHVTWRGRIPAWSSSQIRHLPLALTEQDGTFTIRGVTARSLPLVVVSDWKTTYEDYRLTPAGPTEGPVRPLLVTWRLRSGEFSPAGGVVVDLAAGRDVSGVEIQLTNGPTEDQLCSVTGRIEDPADHFESVSGLTVLLSQWVLGPDDIVTHVGEAYIWYDKASADTEGAFRVERVLSGTYTIIAGARTDYVQLGETVLQPGQGVDLGTLQIPVAGAVRGTALDPQGQPLKGAWVIAHRNPRSVGRGHPGGERWTGPKAEIDELGHYRIDRLDPGYWFLRTTGGRIDEVHPLSAVKRIFANGKTAVLDFRPTYSGRISGRVTDSKGHPLPNVSLRMASGWVAPDMLAATDADGHYECSHLPPATYSVWATHPGCWPALPVAVEVSADRPAVVADFVLYPAAAIKGRVIGAARVENEWQAERPLIEIWAPTHRVRNVAPTSVRPTGAFGTQPLDPGTYVIKARRPDSPSGYWAESEPVAVREGEVAENVIVELPLHGGM